MKFIRDIIGEKRELGRGANGTAVDAAMVDAILEPADDTPAQAPAVEESNPRPGIHTGRDLSDDIAAFFAEEDAAQAEAEAPESDPVAAEPDTERTPSKLILGSEQAISMPQDDNDDQDDTPDVDAVLVPDQDEDTDLRNMFTAPKPSEPAPEPETAQAAPEVTEPTSTPAPEPMPAADPMAGVDVPRPAVGRGVSSHGRVKTRLLGFNTSMDDEIDPMAAAPEAAAAPYSTFPVGWLMVTEGEGRGSAFTLFHGVSSIGRGEDQTVRLDFGDNSISRENHASVAYDPRQKTFYVGHGGKANIVRRNDRPVLSTEELNAGDTITIGETTLRFVPCCGPDFDWEDGQNAARS